MTVERIDRRFAALKAAGKAGLVTYIMAGHPDLDATLDILKGMPAAGADLIELGFPFSDPMAEGPTIQRAAEHALKNGTRIKDVFELVRRFRETDPDTPLILMGYMNPLESLGYEAWAAAMADCGADGAIIVDCPPEEADGVSDAFDAHDVALIRLATPTSDAHRLETLVRRTRGFIYYVSVTGVTGVKSADPAAIAGAVSQVRETGKLPVAVGFGIRTAEAAAAVARIADAAVVGSVLVDEINNSLPESATVSVKVLAKVRELAEAVHSARI